MDLARLAVLRELAERGSVSAVAAATHRSPSAVSQQLKALQRSAGVVLVERVGRGVRLTDAGRALAASAARVATAVAEAEATWDAYRDGTSGTVRVSLFTSAAELLVPGLLHRMAAHPHVSLEVEDHDVAQDDFAAHTREADVVVAHRSDDVVPAERADLRVVPLLREPLDVAVPLDHALAGRDRVPARDLAGERWVGVPPDYPLDRALVALAASIGEPAAVALRFPHLPLIENLVAAGHGIALVPRYASGGRAPGRFHLVEVGDVRAGRHIEALVRPDRAARLTVRTVLEELREQARRVARPGPH